MTQNFLTLDQLLIEATDRNASDIHLATDSPAYVRIDGRLQPISEHHFSEEELRGWLLPIVPHHLQGELEKGHEVDLSYVAPNKMRFRVNLFYERGKLAGAFRLIPHQVPTIQQLGLPPVIESFTKLNWGLVLVTGPTGSGKTTTLAAMVDHINTHKSVHIVTLEDPIEYVHFNKKALVTQREIGRDTPNFHSALRALMREDPDVVLIGEMRDLETIATAITIAETGHLVLATLHTNSAEQTIDRIIDVFPPNQQAQIRTQLAMTLKGVVSQRLLPRTGGGRVAVHEILVVTPGVANLIKEGKTPQIRSIIQTGARYGMATMEQNLKRLMSQGFIDETTVQEYFHKLYD